MKYRKLGKTELRVSVVGIGTWQFGGEWGKVFTQREVDQIFEAARETGINLIDTAECYGDHLSESFVGNAIQKDRSQWVIATKFGHKFHGNFNRSDRWKPEEVRQSLEESLKALKTDWIDIYQFHSGSDERFNQDDLWQMLDDQVKAGKIRHLGISIGSNENIYQTSNATRVNASVIQVIYNRLDQRPEMEVLPACLEQNLGVLARVPLASGLLSGKYKPGTVFQDADDVRSHRDPNEIQERLKLVDQIKKLEVPEGVDMASWALAWCLLHPAVTCVIPGCKNPQQVYTNARASDLDLVSNTHPQALS